MKRNFEINLLDVHGNVMNKEPKVKMADGKPVTKDGEFVFEEPTSFVVAHLIIDALLKPYQNEGELDGKEKLARCDLAMKIAAAAGEEDYTPDECDMIKRLALKGCSTWVYGRVIAILGKDPVPAAPPKRK